MGSFRLLNDREYEADKYNYNEFISKKMKVGI